LVLFEFQTTNLDIPERNRTSEVSIVDSEAVNFPALGSLKIGQNCQEPSMANQAKHRKAQAAAIDAREDIMSPAAISAMSPGVVSAMGAVGAAVIKRHKKTMDKEPDWFWHVFARSEAKAAHVAEQAEHSPDACGDATFIEVYARTLPALLTAALDGHEQAIRGKH
jgi:hypothetical protein